MNFELGKEYIVTVTDNGIIPIDEFNRERFYDKDNDDLDFLTNEEKTIVVDEVLDKIKTEMEKHAYLISMASYEIGLPLFVILRIIDKYQSESEEK